MIRISPTAMVVFATSWMILGATAGPELTAADSPVANEIERRELKQVLRESIKAGVLKPTDGAAIGRFKKFFKATLANKEPLAKLQAMWEQDRWELMELSGGRPQQQPGSRIWVIKEQPLHRHGRGIYAVRVDSKSNVVLQAPHRFNDLKTGLIARKLFEEFDVKAVAWNTLHRKQIDLAHCDRHFFNAFTEAMIEHDTNYTQLQLHGFENEKRKYSGKTAQVIVSDATRFPSHVARRISVELKLTFGDLKVRLFPIGARDLGGTENRQATIAHAAGSTQFVHLEMNAAFRANIVRDASMRKRFIDSVTAATNATQK